MSGSRSNDYSSVNLNGKIGSSRDSAGATQIEMEINKFLEELLKEFNDRNVEAIRIHLNEIVKAIGSEIGGLEQILFGGSLSKRTFIEGMSDIDALVIIDNKSAKGISPQELQDKFYELLSKRFANTKIEKGLLAVTLKFSDYDVQLLPAIREDGRIRIASSTGSGWSQQINTKVFTDKLTNINKMNGNKVVPVIKLAKQLLDSLPEKYKLSGYHVEAIAVEAFENYTGRNALFDMTKHLLATAGKRVLKPMMDITGQSWLIDENFGVEKSLLRQYASKNIEALYGKFSNSNSATIKSLFESDGR